jgi:photosystem II stability/assembly factor-like uncharacterized protein
MLVSLPVLILALTTSLVPYICNGQLWPYFKVQSSGVTVNLRGLSAVSDHIAWASGEKGTVRRTVDGGQTWEKVNSPEIEFGSEDVDYRDIEAFSDTTAIVMAVAKPARLAKICRSHDRSESA